MFGDDDDDIVPSSSREEYYTKSDKGKAEEIKRQAEGKLGVAKASAISKAELKKDVSLKKLKEDIKTEKEMHNETMNNDQQKERAPRTKTRKEEEESRIQSADDQPNTDIMIERQKQEGEVEETEVQDQPG